jgi:hypothetical protein
MGPFERACRLSKNPGALQCSSWIQHKLQAGYVGRTPKDAIQVAPRRKGITHERLPYIGIGNLRFHMEPLRRHLGRPFERASRPSQNPRALQCSLQQQRKRQAGCVGHDPKVSIQIAPRRKDIGDDELSYPGTGKLSFRVGQPWRRLGRQFERACRLSQNPRAL